jgi:lysophospholipase L1-like esterase
VRACPLIHDLVDYNCDERLRIPITGDSIVYGVGDGGTEGEERGYVARLQAALPEAEVYNVGVRGITSSRLLRALKRNLAKDPPGETILKLDAADIVVIAVGVNDFFEHAEPSRTVRNLRRIVAFLRRYYAERGEIVPVIKVSYLTPTLRGYQRPFISAVNDLCRKLRSSALPMGPDYSTLDTSLLGEDGLHPTASGYDVLARTLVRHLRGPVRRQCLRERPDVDGDGVYDKFESERFGTSSSLFDSDNDGHSDGEEIFILRSDPLDASDP